MSEESLLMSGDAMEASTPDEDPSTTGPSRRELLGYFSADTPSRTIAKAIIAAHRKRTATESESPQPADDGSDSTSVRPSRTGQEANDGESTTRALMGYVSADTDVDALVDMIIATVPPNERPPEDRPERLS
jgi:hypothetical protein